MRLADDGGKGADDEHARHGMALSPLRPKQLERALGKAESQIRGWRHAKRRV